MKRIVLLATAATLFAGGSAACAEPESGPAPRGAAAAPAAAAPAAAPAVLRGPHPDSARFMEAARAAWAYVTTYAHERTGLVNATRSYENITTWDMGGLLGAYFSAYRLGIIEREEFLRRTTAALDAMAAAPLFDGGALNKVYAASSARPVDRSGQVSARGFGWSALDIGRVLLWLRILADNEPELAERAAHVAERMDYDRIVRGGYLWGEDLSPAGEVRRYQEGKIGYEQYAERGFRAWGHPADFAADHTTNAVDEDVLGITLPSDRRGRHCLTGEPYYLMGIETGWGVADGELARRILEIQQRRHAQEGVVTMASEDAMVEPPYYFYYYCILGENGPFTIDAQGTREPLPGPRWVSAKAAWAWHALLPDDYTALAVERVAPARTPTGWNSGVYEANGRPTGSVNLNTAAVILEAALYAHLGRPLMEAGPPPGG